MKFRPEQFQRWQPCPPDILAPLLQYLHRRFDLPLDLLQQYQWLQQNLKTLALTHPAHQPPQKPEPMAIGIPALKLGGKMPKITSAAARFFGTAATKHVVELPDRSALQSYLAVARFPLSMDDCIQCTEAGVVIVRYRGIPIGTGFLKLDSPDTPILQSQFSK